jgi:hypothetical protein
MLSMLHLDFLWKLKIFKLIYIHLIQAAKHPSIMLNGSRDKIKILFLNHSILIIYLKNNKLKKLFFSLMQMLFLKNQSKQKLLQMIIKAQIKSLKKTNN